MNPDVALVRAAGISARAGGALALFVALGTVLELLHAVKSPAYVDAGRETSRLLLRLAHAHGTLLSLLNIVFALTVRGRPGAARPLSSACLLASLVLLPGGFLLGGTGPTAGIRDSACSSCRRGRSRFLWGRWWSDEA